MLQRLLRGNLRTTASDRTTRRKVTPRTSRIGHFDILEARSLLSGLSPQLRIINGSPVDPGQPRIINGTPTSDFPSVGEVGDASGGYCTGTLISDRYVLTAGHCAAGVRATAGRFEVGGTTYATSQVFVHPNYNGNRIGVDDSANDLAIFRLNQAVVGIAPSPILRDSPRLGQSLILVGLGAGGTGTSGSNGDFGTKRMGRTPIDGLTPRRVLWTFDNNTESNTAPGDSGGPAYLDVGGVYYVAGVTSGGSKANAGIGDHSYDTRVDAYASWIDSVLGGTPAPDPIPTLDDHANEPEPNATQFPLGADGSFHGAGSLEQAGDRDVFQIQVMERGSATINLGSPDGSVDTYLRVYDSTGKLLAQDDDAGPSTDSRVTLRVSSGVYYISAGSFVDGGAGSYTIDGTISEDDHGDSRDDATVIQMSAGGEGDASGSIGPRGDKDFFKFVAARSGLEVIDLKAATSDIDTVLTVFDARGRRIAFNDDSFGGTDSHVQLRVRAGQTFFIAASGFGDSTGEYSLTLAPGKPTRAQARTIPSDTNQVWETAAVSHSVSIIAHPMRASTGLASGNPTKRLRVLSDSTARGSVAESSAQFRHSKSATAEALDQVLQDWFGISI